MDSIKVKKISEGNINEEESLCRNASDEDFREMQVENLNCSINMLWCSPVKLCGIAEKNRTGYEKRKVSKAS
jgi:hypothetical protein